MPRTKGSCPPSLPPSPPLSHKDIEHPPKWLCQRSQHCFPDLLWLLVWSSSASFSAIRVQLEVPCFSTSLRIASSSWALHIRLLDAEPRTARLRTEQEVRWERKSE